MQNSSDGSIPTLKNTKIPYPLHIQVLTTVSGTLKFDSGRSVGLPIYLLSIQTIHLQLIIDMSAEQFLSVPKNIYRQAWQAETDYI